MFYAKSAPEIRSQSTVLNPQHVFVGDYWDEFALPLFFIPESAKVLVLGLAGGGGIRPLLSSQKNIQLTAVDLDPVSNESCRTYFSNYFSHLKFDIQQSCAHKFIQDSKQDYDAIWVDVYAPDAYWNQMYKDEFWQNLQTRLIQTGVVLINSFGLPWQFSPLLQSSIQRAIVAKLKKYFPYVGVLPHRRNLTLVAANETPVWQGAMAHDDLNRLDKETFRLLSLKSKYLTEITEVDETSCDPTPENLRFAVLDQQMLSSWDDILAEARELGFLAHQRRDLLALIGQPEFVDTYVQRGRADFRMFIPILAAGQSRLMDLKLESLFLWFFANYEGLKEQSPLQFYQVWLPQMWNLLIGSERRYLEFYFQFSNLFKNEDM